MWSMLFSAENSTSAFLTFAAGVLLKVTVVFGAALAATWLLRRRSAAARHLVWLSAATGALLVPVLSFTLPGWGPVALTVPAENVPAQSIEPVEEASEAARALLAQVAIRNSIVPTEHAESPEPVAPAAALITTPMEETTDSGAWVWSIAGVWLIGALVFAIPVFVGATRIEFVRRKSEAVSSSSWLSLLAEVAQGFRLRRRVTLTQSSKGLGPLTAGVLRPFVLLPPSSGEWSTAKRRVVLLHELAHIKRLDVLTQWVAKLSCAVFWMHPLAWLAARQMRIERERACDDLVLAAGEEPMEYSRQLVEFAAQSRQPRWTATATLAMARPQELEDRLHRILDDERDRSPVSRRVLFGVTFLCLALVASVATAGRIVVRDSKGKIVATVTVPDGGSVTVEDLGSGQPAGGGAGISGTDPKNKIDKLIEEKLRWEMPLNVTIDAKEMKVLAEYLLQGEKDSKSTKDTQPADGGADAGDSRPKKPIGKSLAEWGKRDDGKTEDNWEKAIRWHVNPHWQLPAEQCSKCHSTKGLKEHGGKALARASCMSCHAMNQAKDDFLCPGVEQYWGQLWLKNLPKKNQKMPNLKQDPAGGGAGEVDSSKAKPEGGKKEDSKNEARKQTDAEFLRRLMLDTTGLLPTAEQTRDFLEDDSPDKRQKLADHIVRVWDESSGEFIKADSHVVYLDWKSQVDNQQLARQLYALLWERSLKGSTKKNAEKEKQTQQLAQYVFNLVDALDADAKSTKFEYDPDLSDGWSSDPKTLRSVRGVELPASQTPASLAPEELLKMIDQATKAGKKSNEGAAKKAGSAKKSDAQRYRDYVIEAFNEDKPN